ncbi:retinoblastoma-associated protein [Elysia marginata]|uniref:Retinoblastoma-associated protein n=1 Tax=Elysia marginata TaxID=1093978 RepID=A0AAV4K061_9GAST|nr:retinoblastoma-associated protein [Elysia marginata]
MASNGVHTESKEADSTSTENQHHESSPGQRVPVCSPNKEPFHDENVEEFFKFCCLRSIPKVVKQRACYYLQYFTEQGLLSLLPGRKELFALIIYLAEIDTRLPYGTSDPHLKKGHLEPPSISVTNILQMTGVNINELFHTLNVMREKTTLPKSAIAHLKKMEKNYCVVAALFNTFESRLCQSVFRDIREDGEERVLFNRDGFLPPIPETEGVSFRKRQCWALFLLSRHHLLQDNPELFLHFQLLLCCVEFVLRQTPSFLLNSPYDSIRFGCFSTQEAGITMLGKLAEKFQVASDGTLQLHLQRTEPFFQSLLNKDGELDSDSLCEQYEKVYHKEQDLDELQFLNKEPHLMPMPLNKTNQQTSQNKVPPAGSMTPVRQAVSTVDSLHKNFGSGPEKPTEKLCHYFQKCPQDPASKIEGMLKTCKDQFVKAYQSKNSNSDSAVAEQRFLLGVKIYHTVLEAMLNAESTRLTNQMLGTLLNKEDFHKSVLVCSLEVVLTTYGQSLNHSNHEVCMEESSMAFPWLLGVLSLHAYDFLKVIELFVRAERRLPIDVVKHLQCVETRILEQEAWKEGSPVYDALVDQREAGLATPPRLLSPMGSPMKSPAGSPSPGPVTSNGHRDSLDLFLSPVKGNRQQSSSSSSNQLPFSNYSSASSSPSSSAINEDGEQPKPSVPRQSQSLSSFINSVCRLGFSRMSKLCTQLECSKDLQHKIWTCLEHCVTKMPHLLKNRHLDQIIMCCIYGLCKVTEQDILFKDIVTLYRELPGAKQEAPQSPSKMTPNTRLLYSFPESIGGLDSAEKLKHFKYQFEMKQRTLASAKKRLNLDDIGPS